MMRPEQDENSYKWNVFKNEDNPKMKMTLELKTTPKQKWQYKTRNNNIDGLLKKMTNINVL